MVRPLSMFPSIALLLIAFVLPARAASDQTVFVVVLSRHSVRNPTKPLAGYRWPVWYGAPQSDGYLSARGYRLAGYMGSFELAYVHALGLLPPEDCSANRIFAWADIEQRTIESGRAMLHAFEDPSMCAHSIELGHAHQTDPLFHPLAQPSAPRVDAQRSAESLRARALHESINGTLDGVIVRDEAGARALQTLLDARCARTPCAPFTGEPTTIESAPGSLARLHGPLPFASTAAENIFLEYAQCRPTEAITGSQSADAAALIERSMSLHVRDAAIARRNPYTATAEGNSLFAHIVAMLDAAVKRAHPFADAPNMDGAKVALLVGHDTNIAAIAGILDAHWHLGAGMADDDIPPAGALLFELHRRSDAAYDVRVRFATPTIAQYRSGQALRDGASVVPVSLGTCTGSDCRIPLETLERVVTSTQAAPFIERSWPQPDPVEPVYPALQDPPWTQCG